MNKIQITHKLVLAAVLLTASFPISVKAQDQEYEEEFLEFRKKIQLSVTHEEPVELNLQEILAKALENNINLQIAKLNSNEAKWKYWNRFADALPDIYMSAATIHREGTFYLTSTLQNDINQRTSSAAIRFNYRLFNGGTTTFLAWAEKYYRKVVEGRERSQYNLVLYDSVDLYYQLVKAQAVIETRTKSLESARENRKLARQFYEAGTGTKYDFLQAEARLARTEQDLIEAETQFRIAGLNLANHLNSPLATAFSVNRDHIAKLNMIDESLTLLDFVAIAVENNPDIRTSLEARKAAMKEGLSKAGDYLPKVDVYANLGASGETFDNMFGLTTLGFEANYAIGDGLGLTAVSNTMQARARANRAKLEYDRTKLNIERNLRMSYLEFQRTQVKVKVAEKEYEASEEALRLARLRYENGLEIFTNLVDKEAKFTEAEINLIASTADYNLMQAKLAYNMGTISLGSILGLQDG